MQKERKREFPNPEELTALLQKIDAELAIRRTKMDTSRLLGYQIEDLDIRRYICLHVLSIRLQFDGNAVSGCTQPARTATFSR